eukprot:m.132452 g.132452  ORF g.132452 m.132452 type:complete len:714 (+) comp11334_c0_seq1:176-2317(+)
MPMSLLQFSPFASAPDPSFWHALTQLKLNTLQLSDAPVNVVGQYVPGERPDVPARCTVGGEAFSDTPTATNGRVVPMPGSVQNFNTMEDFKSMDMTQTIQRVVCDVWQAIVSGAALHDSSLLIRFALNTFADLKKYHYYYWFAFPVVSFGPGTEVTTDTSGPTPLVDFFDTEDNVATFASTLSAWRVAHPTQVAFVVKRGAAAKGEGPIIGTLAEWSDVYVADTKQFAVGFIDPCALPNNPGWPLRNVLAAIAYHYNPHSDGAQAMPLTVLAVRATMPLSLCVRILLPAAPPRPSAVTSGRGGGDGDDESSSVVGAQPPEVVSGLEVDKKGRLRPRTLNLSASMDPIKLATSAVGLNLSLMRWRLQPDIELEKVAGCKCLLFGAGTLGCNVARLLLGWGVKQITFVDNGKVSYSNPVRQTLFTFEDSKEGRPKAETAASRLKEIFPGVNATGYSLTVPMPGHPVSGDTAKTAIETAATLDKLVQEHDAVFLLMDSREARWLPTVLCAAHNTMCFTAAIGFDTFVAMRHGVVTPTDDDSGGAVPARNVGCYFCNDVIAPTNSTKDRSLDQQCTVSRPGCSMLVSAAVVELLVSILHHPLGMAAPRPSAVDGESLSAGSAQGGSCLGAVPHQVRGMLAEFAQMTLDGQAFDCCTACSPTIVAAYEASLTDLLLGACNTPNYLEDLSGLSALHAGVDELDFDWDDQEDDFDLDDDE